MGKSRRKRRRQRPSKRPTTSKPKTIPGPMPAATTSLRAHLSGLLGRSSAEPGTGKDTKSERSSPSFYKAFTYADGSQGLILILWYAGRDQRQVEGMSFLIDFNPPWEGAVKDIMVLPPRPPKQAEQTYVGAWKRMDMPLKPLDAARAKQKVLQALDANRREGIRLPRDLIRARKAFLAHVLSLPDLANSAPPFTAQDLNRLARTGQTPESIVHFEQTVGRRVRLEDGQELLVIGDPFDDDW